MVPAVQTAPQPGERGDARGLPREEGATRRKRGGLGAMGKAAWDKTVPELSLVFQERTPPRPQPLRADSPGTIPAPPELPVVSGDAQAARLAGPHVSPEALALLRSELGAILALCEEADEPALAVS